MRGHTIISRRSLLRLALVVDGAFLTARPTRGADRVSYSPEDTFARGENGKAPQWSSSAGRERTYGPSPQAFLAEVAEMLAQPRRL
jgi:hypothetical protein